ncbi:hypothetical protein KXD93_29150 [Mucilaginibacter sp. BJC16-A38]|uniref:hypothetical protein n=1 Tax=Mucilaginibacter phenanthrenivorans TaxID=1234842 RepID=UPI0021571E93|nr:hypothetical protein [Mucilaginibacter phenanthrenivorans]MCR8561759.1 hypothetical protein [Mucilaginibacter phenanthrenivorans]
MKNITLVFLILICFQNTFAQLNTQNVQDEMFTISAGPNRMFLNNRDFNAWTAANYNLLEKISTGFRVDLSFIGRKYDAGLLLGGDSKLTTVLGYFGAKLTNKYSSISSWLNVEAGEIYAVYKDIAPVNYVLIHREIGKDLELHYGAGYIGLSSKNYLNFLHWNIKIGKGAIPVNAGFYASVGFTPFARNWRYGYYKYTDSDTTFKSRKVNSIPKLSKVYANTGVFIGF